ncbi:MAG: YccF domain-containing protein [Proteobacteria bacterium]|nr:YccF domain-containing protein [Pseudomonadota bacterium]
MRLLLNLLWFIFGGWISGSLWVLAGCIFCLTVVGIPWAPAAFRLAGFSYWPFGKELIDRDDGPASCLLNVLWLLLAGWWLALHHLVIAIPLFVSIIGIPFALQHVKLAMASLTPVGKDVILAYYY